MLWRPWPTMRRETYRSEQTAGSEPRPRDLSVGADGGVGRTAPGATYRSEQTAGSGDPAQSADGLGRPAPTADDGVGRICQSVLRGSLWLRPRQLVQ